MSDLRTKLIRLAHQQPSLRPHLLPMLKTAARKWKALPRVGKTYTVGYRQRTWDSTFIGWKIEGGEPRMVWVDGGTGTEWEAYIFDGVVSIGTSADPLLILGESR